MVNVGQWLIKDGQVALSGWIVQVICWHVLIGGFLDQWKNAMWHLPKVGLEV